jgi:Xaa-Pro aminopeptidase
MISEGERCERRGRVATALTGYGMSAVLCAHNLNVLMLSGFSPAVGAALALVTADGRLILVVPKDAEHLARCAWADDILCFEPASLSSLDSGRASLKNALAAALARAFPHAAHAGLVIGHESGPAHLPASYASQLVYGGMLSELLEEIVPSARLCPADDMLMALRMRPTAWELGRIRAACGIAAQAYRDGVAMLQSGLTEMDAVLPFHAALCRCAAGHDQKMVRADAFFYCMSGPNAARAYAAFQQSGQRKLQGGEPVLIHCNSSADGYWTDLTRTYVLGEPDARLRGIQEAISAARDAAFDEIRPGVPAALVDRAARTVLEAAGFGAAFRHPTGHGVGFTAIDHEERPRIHPCSDDVLEEGMVFNVEPGVYIDGYGGFRDCNMVAVTGEGYELLSPFHLNTNDWRLVREGREAPAPNENAGQQAGIDDHLRPRQPDPIPFRQVRTT